MKKVDVFVKGPGSGRETAIRSLQATGLEVGSRGLRPVQGLRVQCELKGQMSKVEQRAIACACAVGQQRIPIGHLAALAKALGPEVRIEAGIVRRVVSEGDRRRSYVQLVGDAFDTLLGRGQTIAAPRVLFVCTRNSARSVLAAALWMRASEVPVASAGTDPAPNVHPTAIRSAVRHGLIPSADPLFPSAALGRPKHVRDVAQPGDFVVSTCDEARETLVRGAPPSLAPGTAGPPAGFFVMPCEMYSRMSSRVTPCCLSRTRGWAST